MLRTGIGLIWDQNALVPMDIQDLSGMYRTFSYTYNALSGHVWDVPGSVWEVPKFTGRGTMGSIHDVYGMYIKSTGI